MAYSAACLVAAAVEELAVDFVVMASKTKMTPC
jgi:hypothetical protein